MIPNPNAPRPDYLLVELRNTLNKITASHGTKEQRQRQGELIATISQKKQEESLSVETKVLRAQLERKRNELQELRQKLNEQEHEITNNYKRQFRHLSDTLVEKQAELQYLNKHVQTLKNRITSLEQDLNQSNSSRKSLEQSLVKTVELIKSQFKELFDVNQDLQLNRFMSETNLKQINDKLDALLNVCIDLEKKKTFMEDKYSMLKKQHTEQIGNNIKLEVQLEKLKEQLWQEKRIIQSYNNDKKFAVQQCQFFSKKSKSSRLSGGASQMVSQEEKNHPLHSQSSHFQNLDQTISLLKAQTTMLLNFEQKLISLNKKINQDTDIWHQVVTVKQINTGLQLQLNEVKAKLNPEHQDLLLKQKHPTLCEFFTQKMNQVQQFQKRLQNVEKDAYRVTQTFDNILYNGLPEKQLKPNEQEILDKQNAIRSKVKKEMLQTFESEKETILKDAQKHYQDQIQTLKDKITDLNHEVARLQDKNENLFELLQESQKLNQKKVSTKEKPQKMEIQQPGVERNLSEKVQTQSIIAVDPSQISHMNFLEEKTERLEQQLKECKGKIDIYKKEIRQIMETYKLRNTKHKSLRCNECLIRINENDDNGMKCQKCKIDIHDGECAKAHEKVCKKNTTSNNKAKPKKPETKPPIFSQRIDYF